MIGNILSEYFYMHIYQMRLFLAMAAWLCGWQSWSSTTFVQAEISNYLMEIIIFF